MTFPLVARKPPEPFLSGEPNWGDVLTDIDKYGGNWPDIFFKNPKKSPTIGPYPEIKKDDFQQQVNWIAGLDIDEKTKKELLGIFAHQVLLPKGKVTTPEELDKFLEVASRYGKDAVMTQAKNLENIARQKAIYNVGESAIRGAEAVAIAGLPHKDYVSGHGLTAGLGKPSNIARTYFG
jgi:hypothetical protein